MKKVAVFTSIRSEYGLLSPLLEKFKQHDSFKLELIVGGAHLVKEYGQTVTFIEADDIPIACKLPFLFGDEEKDVLTRSLASLQQQIGKYFSENKPDILVVLGDRIELLPVVLAATLNKIPIAHISGGETTEGAIDNQVRHALTKLSHIHFPATKIYAKNIISMGEEPWRVCVSGEPGLDLIDRINYIDKVDLYAQLGLDEKKPVVLVTFHPETISNKITPQLVSSVCKALIYREYQVLATAANFDEGGPEINRVYESFVSQKMISYQKSLGQLRYYSMLKYAAMMVGNSSSGLVEAQSFNLPVLNIGDRQKGRLAGLNVIHVPADFHSIERGIQVALSVEFKKQYFDQPNIYGDGQACNRIISYLEQVEWQKLLVKKDNFCVE